MTDDFPAAFTPAPRRGRPPNNPNSPADTAPEAAPAPTSRRRRSQVGDFAMKLLAPARPGFMRRWFNDKDNRIADAGELAYDHVMQAGIETSDPGARISRLVGTKPNGEPMRAYLMETPTELYAEGVAERESHNRLVEQAILDGRDSTGKMGTDAPIYGQGSIQRDR
jgi:hypothetical protein